MAAAAAAEQQPAEAPAPLPPHAGSVPVLFCFSVFARPATVPHGSGYEVLIQKFLSLYSDLLDMHRKFVVQLFSEEWSQYVDLPKGFVVGERCKVRLVPLQIQVGGERERSPRAPLPLPGEGSFLALSSRTPTSGQEKGMVLAHPHALETVRERAPKMAGGLE